MSKNERDSDPLSPETDNWSDDPEMNRAILMGRAYESMLAKPFIPKKSSGPDVSDVSDVSNVPTEHPFKVSYRADRFDLMTLVGRYEHIVDDTKFGYKTGVPFYTRWGAKRYPKHTFDYWVKFAKPDDPIRFIPGTVFRRTPRE